MGHGVPILTHRELYRLLKVVAIDRSSSAAVFQNQDHRLFFRPETDHQSELIVELVRREKQTVRTVGTSHSPGDSNLHVRLHDPDTLT